MATFCPHCQNPIAHNSALAGQNVACPYCQAAFTMPFCTPAEPQIKPPVRSRAKRAKRAKWARIPLVKKLMLIATLLWPVAIVSFGSLSAMADIGDEDQYVRKMMTYSNIHTGLYTEADYRRDSLGTSFAAAIFVFTALYVSAMIILFVIWFATRDSSSADRSY